MKLFQHEAILYQAKGLHGTVTVTERNGRRELRFGNHIIQSAMALHSPELLALDYNRAMTVGFLFAPEAASILQVGLGAGSLTRFIHRYQPEAQQHVVELDPVVVTVARQFFELPDSPRVQVVEDDAAAYLQRSAERYDLIFLDAYGPDGVAPHLESRSYLRMVGTHLSPGGWMVNNVWGSDRRHLRELRARMVAEFAQVHALSVRADSNVIFVCGHSPRILPGRALQARAEALEDRMPVEFRTYLRGIRRLSPEPGQPEPAATGL